MRDAANLVLFSSKWSWNEYRIHGAMTHEEGCSDDKSLKPVYAKTRLS
jgi:hypothetical protein